MGTYINPTDGSSKENFLEKHGEKISSSDFKAKDFNNLLADGKVAVGLVDNGAFSAAIVCDTKRELDYVQGMINDDPRPFQAHLVPAEALYEAIDDYAAEAIKTAMQEVGSST